MARRQVDRMSQTTWTPWRIKRQFGLISYRLELLLPMNQLHTVVRLWK